MAETKTTETDKILTIPLREAYKKAEGKRAPYASRYVKKFIALHTKSDDIKIGSKLNEAIWLRGIDKPLRKVRVNIVRDGTTVKAELVGFEYTEFKVKPKQEKKGAKEKLMERLGAKAIKNEEEEKKIEGKDATSSSKASHDTHTKEKSKIG